MRSNTTKDSSASISKRSSRATQSSPRNDLAKKTTKPKSFQIKIHDSSLPKKLSKVDKASPISERIPPNLDEYFTLHPTTV